MEKLIEQLRRLYLPPDGPPPDILAQHLRGDTSVAISLATEDGLVRAIVIPFDKLGHGEDAQHWGRLSKVANALQGELGLPSPAVSVSGTKGYRLWLSFEAPIPSAQAQRFLKQLYLSYLPDVETAPDAVSTPVLLPPHRDQRTGKWAAFIHPEMGASFADDAGLDMAPPLAGQVGFLEELESISLEQFYKALGMMQQENNTAPPSEADNMPSASESTLQRRAAPDDLLLKDATLEDIVKFLHAKNIEPTFRHLMPR
jgi:hypothetical protein